MKPNHHNSAPSRQVSRQREDNHVTPSIHFRRMKCCPKCGADKQGFEFIIMDDQPGERTAKPEELMKYGFHVPPASVDLVASLIAQQVGKWNGLTSTIPGVALSDHPYVEPVTEAERIDQLKASVQENMGALLRRGLINQELFTKRHARALEGLQAGLLLSQRHKLPADLLGLAATRVVGSSRAIRTPKVVEVGKKAGRRKS